MNQVETRQANRDSLFLMARIRVDGSEETHPAKVRNLSAGGMMAECTVRVARGTPVSVELRNVGWVDGSVAWTQGDRFGIAFVEEIEPASVRAFQSAVERSDEVRRYSPLASQAPNPDKLRKI